MYIVISQYIFMYIYRIALDLALKAELIEDL
jgi:hypothetical protein